MSFLNELKRSNVFIGRRAYIVLSVGCHEGQCQFASTPAVLLSHQVS